MDKNLLTGAKAQELWNEAFPINGGWTDEELKVLISLAEKHDMSELSVLRQALRMYQMHDARLADGETCSYSGDVKRAREFLGTATENDADRDFPPAEIHTNVHIIQTGDDYFEHAQWEGPAVYIRKDIALEDKLEAVRQAKND